jgi:hypothetical protein
MTGVIDDMFSRRMRGRRRVWVRVNALMEDRSDNARSEGKEIRYMVISLGGYGG